jgi:hypothetical protein
MIDSQDQQRVVSHSTIMYQSIITTHHVGDAGSWLCLHSWATREWEHRTSLIRSRGLPPSENTWMETLAVRTGVGWASNKIETLFLGTTPNNFVQESKDSMASRRCHNKTRIHRNEQNCGHYFCGHQKTHTPPFNTIDREPGRCRQVWQTNMC